MRRKYQNQAMEVVERCNRSVPIVPLSPARVLCLTIGTTFQGQNYYSLFRQQSTANQSINQSLATLIRSTRTVIECEYLIFSR